MDPKQFDAMLSDAEVRLRRLKVLYDQWFMGIERTEPAQLKKELEDLLAKLKREQVTNTAAKFRLNTVVQRHVTFTTYWRRIARQIEEGTFKRDLVRARKLKKRNADDEDADLNYEIDVELDLDMDMDMDAALAEAQEASDRAAEPVIPIEPAKPAPQPKAAKAPAKAEVPAAPAAVPLPPIAAAPRVPASNAPKLSVPQAAGGAVAKPAPPARAAAGKAAPAVPAPAATAAAAALAATAATDATAGPAKSAPAKPLPAKPVPPKAASAVAALASAVGKPQPVAAPGEAAARPAPPPPSAAGPRPAPPVAKAPAPPPAVSRATGPQPIIQPLKSQTPAGTSPGKPQPIAAKATQTAGSERNGAKPVLSSEDVQRIYSNYVAARKQNSERVDNVKFDSIEKTLRGMLPQLEKKHAGKKIDFEVVVKDGKVALKPVAK